MTREELIIKQALPLDLKIMKFKKDIMKFYYELGGKMYIGWSGGKDSTLGLYIIMEMVKDGMLPKMPSIVFSNTGQEYKGIVEHVHSVAKENNLKVNILKPKIYEKMKKEGYQHHELWEYVGYPAVSKMVSMAILRYRNAKKVVLKELEKARRGEEYDKELILKKRESMRTRLFGGKYTKGKLEGQRGHTGKIGKWKQFINTDYEISFKCCDHLKKEPFETYHKKTGEYPISFTRVQESQLRLERWLQVGCVDLGDKPQCKPLSVWTDEDVEEAIKMYKVPLSKEYTEMNLKSTGCRSCPFGAHLEKGENRFQKNAKFYPKEHKHDMEYMGMQKVLDDMGVSTDPKYDLTKEGDKQFKLF